MKTTEIKEEKKKDDEKSESSEHSEHSDHEDAAKKDPNAPDAHKSSKGEKRFKKAMIKSGSIPIDTVKRVTIRTNKNFVMYVDKPSVLKTGEKENTYVVFGEPKFLDFKSQMASKGAEKFADGTKPDAAIESKPADIKKVEEPEDDKQEEILPTDKFTQENVDHMMDYSKVSRNKAIRLLREAGGDIVEAITKVN